MADQYDKPHSDEQGAGYVGKERMIQTQMDAQIHQTRQEDEREGGEIPASAGNDFTFPDEDQNLGRKAGDDLPGEQVKNRE